jgi:hypothetical protein
MLRWFITCPILFFYLVCWRLTFLSFYARREKRSEMCDFEWNQQANTKQNKQFIGCHRVGRRSLSETCCWLKKQRHPYKWGRREGHTAKKWNLDLDLGNSLNCLVFVFLLLNNHFSFLLFIRLPFCFLLDFLNFDIFLFWLGLRAP